MIKPESYNRPSRYYRPVWTCGRYNEKAQVAIFYNLITGVSYFFESYSAKVIGEILSVPRNGSIIVNEVSCKLNIADESLRPFFGQLEQLGIVSSVFPSKEIIADYRKRVSEYNCRQTRTVELTTKEKLPYNVSNAEKLYNDRTFSSDFYYSHSCFHFASGSSERVALRS